LEVAEEIERTAEIYLLLAGRRTSPIPDEERSRLVTGTQWGMKFMASAISLFSGLALEKVLSGAILPAFTDRTGEAVIGTFEPTRVLVDMITNGARPDLMIGVHEALRDLALAPDPVLSEHSLKALVRSGIGVAVPAGSPQPRIRTVDELRTALLDGGRVAYSRTGASGIYFADLLVTLGIADAVNERACIIDKGFVAETLLDGRADLAVQQLVELAFVDGIQIVGPLPGEAQQHIELSAATSAASSMAGTLLEFLYSADAARAYRSAGLEPMFEVDDE
jgi:molybdate transport system substrate-binding protein